MPGVHTENNIFYYHVLFTYHGNFIFYSASSVIVMDSDVPSFFFHLVYAIWCGIQVGFITYYPIVITFSAELTGDSQDDYFLC